jgi:pimeloyl-ACP methyl ester carboxylesterase
LYQRLLDHLDLADITVVGNSVGGWITAEIALLKSSRVSGIVLIDAVSGCPATRSRTSSP